MKTLRYALAAAVIFASAPALAGGMMSQTPHCRYFEQAGELVSYSGRERHALKAEVERRYYEAVDVSTSPKTIYTVGGVANHINPLYLWANQAKINCAKALGYLKTGPRLFSAEFDQETLQKCECFYERMVYYSRR